MFDELMRALLQQLVPFLPVLVPLAVAPRFIVWGRCPAFATEADHVFAWSRRGPTIVSNGQALCRDHNRSKSNLRPPWWYVRGLERRRTAYFPAGASVRVLARMSAEERAARAVPSRRARH